MSMRVEILRFIHMSIHMDSDYKSTVFQSLQEEK